MDRRFIEHYDIELGHLRRMADEFKRDYPKVAARLALGMDPPDPYVERLLEGFAFLAARVQLKIEAEFPRFVQSLLETVYPHYLSPLPAMAIVRFEPDINDAALAPGFEISRGTVLRSVLAPGETTQCIFTTGQAVRLLPIQVVEARYFTRDISELALPDSLQARAALRLRLKAAASLPFKEINLDQLVLFLPGTDELPGLLYEQIFAHKLALVVQSASRPVQRFGLLPPGSVRRVGFGDDEGLLPPGPRLFSGYRLLQEYFAFPQRFLFVELSGMGPAARQCAADEIDLVVALRAADSGLEKRHVDKERFSLFCAPAINLFRKDGIKVDLHKQRSEYHIVPDKVRTIDYEVYQLERVTGVSAVPGERPDFQPFYFASDRGEQRAAFYTTHRVPRNLTDRERRFGPVSDYFGTDFYVSLVDADAAPYRADLHELDVVALCTNRHLPKRLVSQDRTQLHLDVSGPVHGAWTDVMTAPRPHQADGEMAWKTLSHFALNYRSLLEEGGGEQGAIALRELLKLYADLTDGLVVAQIRGLRSAKARPILRRLQVPGPICFGRGLEITLQFDETPFAGMGVFLLGAVLEQFFARYVSVNSFTETVIATDQRGEIMRWPSQMGKRQIL
jgi:type VI secretion system protein ImpG